jgi:hypothetical protein
MPKMMPKKMTISKVSDFYNKKKKKKNKEKKIGQFNIFFLKQVNIFFCYM